MNPQKFVVAVSGGVDSIVLLHMLQTRKRGHVSYIVAHFDHGMRVNSASDAEFVKQLAKSYGLPFKSQQGNLGSAASEATARAARYAYLRKIKDEYKAEKIITAHHQDDVIETMVINIIRGTGPRGLAPMQHQTDILRPLLSKRKKELYNYATAHGLEWREDDTNTDENYLRNYIRMNIMPKLEPAFSDLLARNESIEKLYIDIDMRVAGIMYGTRTIYRPKFVFYPFLVQREIVRAWLVKSGITDLDKQLIERITVAIKTLPIGKKIDISGEHWLKSEKQNVYISAKM